MGKLNEHNMKFQDFTHLYPLSKTLRFELKPIGKTLDHIESKNFLHQDKQRAEDYKKVKRMQMEIGSIPVIILAKEIHCLNITNV